jgi:hypothetical protein
MAEIGKSLEDVLQEVRDELDRLSSEHLPSVPRYSSEDGLRIVEQSRDARATSKSREGSEAA